MTEILSGRKIWEIRGSTTTVRGPIALILAGSGSVVGVCDIVDVVGPLTVRDLWKQAPKHRIPKSMLRNGPPYKKTFAWVIANARRLGEPIAYPHPRGAIIWVNLNATDLLSV